MLPLLLFGTLAMCGAMARPDEDACIDARGGHPPPTLVNWLACGRAGERVVDHPLSGNGVGGTGTLAGHPSGWRSVAAIMLFAEPTAGTMLAMTSGWVADVVWSNHPSARATMGVEVLGGVGAAGSGGDLRSPEQR